MINNAESVGSVRAHIDDAQCHRSCSGDEYVECQLYAIETGERLCSDIIWLTGDRARSGHSKLIELGLYHRLGELLVEPGSTEWFTGQVIVSLEGGEGGLRVADDADGFSFGYRKWSEVN